METCIESWKYTKCKFVCMDIDFLNGYWVDIGYVFGDWMDDGYLK